MLSTQAAAKFKKKLIQKGYVWTRIAEDSTVLLADDGAATSEFCA
jgi:hypothetical protein